jgi:hypothetical protein
MRSASNFFISLICYHIPSAVFGILASHPRASAILGPGLSATAATTR